MAEGESFGDVAVGDFGGGIEVGDSAGDFDDLKITAGREIEAVGGGGQEVFRGLSHFEEDADVVGGKGTVVKIIRTEAGALGGEGF